MSKLGKCSICKNKKKLCKAHIIPQWLYSLDEGALEVTDFRTYTRRLPIGVYDKNIICIDCDRDILGFYDEKAKFIFEKIKNQTLNLDINNNQICKVSIDNKEINLLIKFLLSILLRAHYSKQNLGTIVNLGYFYEDMILKTLLDRNKNVDSFLEFFIFKYDYSIMSNIEFNQKVITHSKLGFLNIYSIDFEGFSFGLKVSKSRMVKLLLNINKFSDNFIFNSYSNYISVALCPIQNSKVWKTIVNIYHKHS